MPRARKRGRSDDAGPASAHDQEEDGVPQTSADDWDEGMYKVRRVLDHRRVRGGGTEYEVQWAGTDRHGNLWPNWWVAEDDVTHDLVEAYYEKRGCGVPMVKAEVNVTLVYEEVRRRVAQVVLKGAPTKSGAFNGSNRPRVHVLHLESMSLRDIAVPMLEVARKHGGPPLQLAHGNKGENDEWWQLTVKDLDRIAAFCNFQQFIDHVRCSGNIRLTGNRKHSGDLMAIAQPLLLTVRTVRPGIVTTTIEFPTVHFNGKTGRPTYPPMETGMLKREPSRRDLIRHVRDALPAQHPLRMNGWAALPADVAAIAVEHAMFVPPTRAATGS